MEAIKWSGFWQSPLYPLTRTISQTALQKTLSHEDCISAFHFSHTSPHQQTHTCTHTRWIAFAISYAIISSQAKVRRIISTTWVLSVHFSVYNQKAEVCVLVIRQIAIISLPNNCYSTQHYSYDADEMRFPPVTSFIFLTFQFYSAEYDEYRDFSSFKAGLPNFFFKIII